MMHKSKYNLAPEYIESFSLPSLSETVRQILGYLEWRPPQGKDLFHSAAQVFNSFDKDLKSGKKS